MTPGRLDVSPDVAIIGAGPAGLTAAATLAGRHRRSVLVLDREEVAGGVPRHCDHTGFGIRDMHMVLSGPSYARRLVQQARNAGADLRTQAMVTDIHGDNSLSVTTPAGLLHVTPRAVIVATGARERPRAARLIPGDRGAGIYTTGQLQNLVHLHHQPVGTRAVVVGSESVSWSAVLTLREARCSTVLMTTHYDRSESYRAFSVAGRPLLQAPVATRTRIARIIGKPRVQAVEIEHIDTGHRRRIDCDTVILTGDWIPDHELLRSADIAVDPASRGPLVDTALRTSRDGVFAIGNLCHPVDTADVAALDGHAVATRVDAYLSTASTAPSQAVRLYAGPALRWIAPGVVRAGDPAPPRGRLLSWTDHRVRRPRITLCQNGRMIASRQLSWPAVPGRVFRIPADLLDAVDYTGGDVTIDIANAARRGKSAGAV